jgi:hypothetical protein
VSYRISSGSSRGATRGRATSGASGGAIGVVAAERCWAGTIARGGTCVGAVFNSGIACTGFGILTCSCAATATLQHSTSALAIRACRAAPSAHALIVKARGAPTSRVARAARRLALARRALESVEFGVWSMAILRIDALRMPWRKTSIEVLGQAGTTASRAR